MLVSSPRIVANLRGIAKALSSNPADRDDLLQEMLIHLWQNEVTNPGQTESWYLQSCKFFGMDYLKRGRSVDSKHRSGCVLISMDEEISDTAPAVEPSNGRDFRNQLFAGDALALLRRRLTSAQRMLLDAFASGSSVSEVSEALGCSHQYVSKERKKIALTLAAMLT
jgi:DNA-directed RNA polymerase specialized sigma24 family protein